MPSSTPSRCRRFAPRHQLRGKARGLHTAGSTFPTPRCSPRSCGATPPLTGLSPHQTANLAWPADRAWFVASEIDLPWTYVGGTAALVDAVLSDGRIEALPASPTDPLSSLEERIDRLAEEATAELIDTGHVLIDTSRGTVEAWLEHPTRWHSGEIRTERVGDNGVRRTSGTPLHRSEDLHRAARFVLLHAVLGLVEE